MTRSHARGRTLAAVISAALLTTVLVPTVPALAASTPTPPPIIVGSEIVSSGAGAAGSMNLTALGDLGWVHADGNGIEHKEAARAPITVTDLHPDTPVATLTDSPIAFSWSDGTTTTSASGNTTGAVYRYDLSTVGDTTAYDAGYRVSVPAADSVRQLVLVGGIWQADAGYTVTTLDGTKMHTSALSAGTSASVRKTTITMRPGEGAIVTATLSRTHGTDGNVSFMGAYLHSLESGLQLSTTPAPSTMNLTVAGTLDWLHFDGSSLDRSSDGNGDLSATNRDSAGTINRQGDNPTSYSWTNGTPTASQTGTTTGGVFLARNGDFSQPWGGTSTSRPNRAPAPCSSSPAPGRRAPR